MPKLLAVAVLLALLAPWMLEQLTAFGVAMERAYREGVAPFLEGDRGSEQALTRGLALRAPAGIYV